MPILSLFAAWLHYIIVFASKPFNFPPFRFKFATLAGARKRPPAPLAGRLHFAGRAVIMGAGIEKKKAGGTMTIRKYAFEPDYNNLVLAARNIWPPRLPLYEHIVGPKVMYETTGLKPMDGLYSKDMAESRLAFSQYWDFWRQMGYDTASVEFLVTDILPGGGALGRHQPGAIKTRSDFDRYPWDKLEDLYFERYAPYIKNLTDTCPPGMKAVGGVGNGLFECVQDHGWLYRAVLHPRARTRELYRDLFRAMGDAALAAIWTRFHPPSSRTSFACCASATTWASTR